MPGPRELERIALGHDTTMARAMLRALGVPRPWRFRAGAGHEPARGRARHYAYAGMGECFRNERSPMDGLR